MTTETQAPDPAPVQRKYSVVYQGVYEMVHLEVAGVYEDSAATVVTVKIPAPEGAHLPPLPDNPDADGWTNGQADAIEDWGREAIRAVLAAPAPQAPAWQPIKTAPKDGTEVWAFNGEQGRMKWIEGDGYALWTWADTLLSDTDPMPEQPTHFLPLPADPQTKGPTNDR